MIQVRNGLRGFYKLETFKAEKTEGGLREHPGSRRTLAEFENLITDLGLNAIGTVRLSQVASFCHVGSGATPPAFIDTNMESVIASTSNANDSVLSAQASEEPWYLFTRARYRFLKGRATGTISEVGMGWNANADGALFSRALIQDADGNPSSITVLADEFLDVTYELRVYPDLSDFTGIVNVGGVDYNYIARASRANNSDRGAWDMRLAACVPSVVQGSYAHSGTIGSLSNIPSGDRANAGVLSGTYTEGSREGWAEFNWGLDGANFETGVRSISMGVGWTRWQIQFNAVSDGSAIPKDSNKTLSFTLTHGWARG